MERQFTIASRQSELAMVQSEYIKRKIGGEIVGISSEGDSNLQQPLYQMSSVGVFVKSLEVELLSNKADVAVHSLKDMPTETPQGLTIACIPEFTVPRGEAAVIKDGFSCLEDLPVNSRIGTSSLRRTAYLNHKYAHKSFEILNIRGNLNTRVSKLQSGEYDCIILAAAGVHRLGWSHRLNIEYLAERDILYAPGQGALGVECRSEDSEMVEYLGRFADKETTLRCTAERTFLRELEGVLHI